MATKNFISCSVCDVTCPSEKSLADHVRGRGHQTQLDRRREALCNVFVRGFPKHTLLTVDLVSRLFQQYGPVTNVFVKDVFAIVTFADEASAAAALGKPPQLEGKPLVVKPRDYKPNKRPKPVVMETELSSKSCLPVSENDRKLFKNIITLSGQLELLSSLVAMTTNTMRSVLSLCCSLETILRREFPCSSLMPFGSLITGLGTLTSDVDLALLLQPPPSHITHLLTPQQYYPPTLLQLSEQCEPSSPTHSTTSTHSTPERSIKCELRRVADLVQSRADCERTFLIRHARCPIVRFYHRPSGLHVDISVDNGLAVHNSRLLRAYNEFDGRVTPLVRAAKLWMREFSQRKVNSYAATIMMIHCLQHTTPPVLPCLQELGPWPRNMDWFTTHTPTHHVTVGPWSCDFTPGQSLQPSTNTASLGILWGHFLRYYSEFPYDGRVVAVHTLTPLTPAAANKGISKPMVSKSPLIVQDPFEHCHNVCKNVNKQVFSQLIAHLSAASHCVQQETPCLVELFTSTTLPLPPTTHVTKTLALTHHIVSTLTHLPLTNLALHTPVTRQALHRLIAHKLATLLETKFSFHCEPLLDHVTSPTDHVTFPADHVTFPADHVTFPADHVTYHTDQVTSPTDHVISPVNHVTSDTEMEHSNTEYSIDKATARKRRLSTSPPPEKRVKDISSSIVSLSDNLLESVSSLPPTNTYHCVAHENTWTGCRARRREGMAAALPTPSAPLLELTLSVSGEGVGTLTFTASHPHHKPHINNLFAVFKPLLTQL